MNIYKILSAMEETLDQLISNSRHLIECEEEGKKSTSLEYQQEVLLHSLLEMNEKVESYDKAYVLRGMSHTYNLLEKKTACLSSMNRRLLRSSSLRRAKVVHKKTN